MKSKTVLAICGSPRASGYSARLLERACGVFAAAGWTVRKFSAASENFAACTGCLACHATGKCVFDDTLARLNAELEAADCLLVASPVYFYSLTSQLKRLIDRCQPLWARRTLLGQHTGEKKRPCGFIAVAGGDGQGRTFLPGEIEMKCFGASCGFELREHLKVCNTDALAPEAFAAYEAKTEEMAKRLLAACSA